MQYRSCLQFFHCAYTTTTTTRQILFWAWLGHRDDEGINEPARPCLSLADSFVVVVPWYVGVVVQTLMAQKG